MYFIPLGGNNGDHLLALGSRHALARAGIEPAATQEEADAIVVNGGGGITVELWSPGFGSLRRLAGLAPSKPLIVLPSSYLATATDLATCFVDRRAPLWLFARERFSLAFLDRLSFPGETYLGIDHDMAFALRDSEFLADLRARSTAEHLLLVERFDHECSTGQGDTVKRLYGLKSLIPLRFRAATKILVAGYFSARSRFAKEASKRLRAMHPELAAHPLVEDDISFRARHSFDAFVDIIVRSAAVATTRLHVGILAALLGKPTLLKTATGPYQKIRGCYEYSMSGLPNVRLW